MRREMNKLTRTRRESKERGSWRRQKSSLSRPTMHTHATAQQPPPVPRDYSPRGLSCGQPSTRPAGSRREGSRVVADVDGVAEESVLMQAVQRLEERGFCCFVV